MQNDTTMQVKLSQAAKAKVTSWLDNLQVGDTIRVNAAGVTMYNASGCDIDYVAANAKK